MVHQALYRKWRPQAFADVVGQEHITETLKRQLASDRVAHAYIFVGTRGTGKTTCAKILAKAVNCTNLQEGDPCNVCDACVLVTDGRAMDVVEMDAASNNGVDHVRALREEAAFTPGSLRRRVYIIDEVHMLSTSAWNALLKILEEPPAHLLFILATTEVHKLPATIVSRCQRFAFRRVSADAIESRLRHVAAAENIQMTDGAIAQLVLLADGGMRDALSLMEQCIVDGKIDESGILQALGLAGSDEIVSLLGYFAKQDLQGALSKLDGLHQAGKSLRGVIDSVATLTRDALIGRMADSESALLSGQFSPQQLLQFAECDLFWLYAVLESAEKTLRTLAQSANVKLSAELFAIKLCQGEQPVPQVAVQTVVQAVKPVAVAPPAPSAPASVKAEKPTPQPELAVKDAPPWDDAPKLGGDPPSSPPVQKVAPSPPPTPEPVQAGGDMWQDILTAVKPQLDVSIHALLSDGREVSGVVEDTRLCVYVENDFTRMMISTTEVQEKLRQGAEDTLGRPVALEILAGRPADSRTAGNSALDALIGKGFSNIEVI